MEKTCADCRRFVQHWREGTRRDDVGKAAFFPVSCGHCTYPRVKPRTPDTPACPHFLEKDPGAD